MSVICKFYNSGFCKYHMKGCMFKHPPEICSSDSCVDRRCQKRHPKICRYYKKCRFGKKCMYKHESKNTKMVKSKANNEYITDQKSIEQLEKNNEELLKQITEKEENREN